MGTKLCESGGGKRDRTADLLHAMQALSQLSYTPVEGCELYWNGLFVAKKAAPIYAG